MRAVAVGFPGIDQFLNRIGEMHQATICLPLRFSEFPNAVCHLLNSSVKPGVGVDQGIDPCLLVDTYRHTGPN